MWPNKAPFRRAARWDGVVPIHKQYEEQAISPADTRDIIRYVMEHRQADGSIISTIISISLKKRS